MKTFVSTLCLLVASFVILGVEADSDPISRRWLWERRNFKTGRQMKNDRGELVNVTLSSEPILKNRNFTAKVNFFLYTNRHPSGSVEIKFDNNSVSQSYFDRSLPTVFITHGWINNSSSNSCALIRDAYLKHGGFNVIAVDWGSKSFSVYEIAVWHVHEVGLKVAELIRHLAKNKCLKITETILVGHSLGAHVMGTAGYTLGGAVRAIFGLDPALPLFRSAAAGWKLAKSDATYVEIIHTNIGWLGMNGFFGHADFFVNDGLDQPNCNAVIDNPCSHARAYEVFAESINSPLPFLGGKCSSLMDVVQRMCVGRPGGVLGGTNMGSKVKGVFEVITNTVPPYAMGEQNR